MAWALCGCGTSVGINSQIHAIDRDVARYGPELGYHYYAFESQGLVVGATGMYLPPRGAACCHEFRIRPQAGYGILPLPHQSRLGFELLTGPSFGRMEAQGDGHWGIGGMAELGVPLRLTHTRDLWEQSLFETIGILVPKVGLEIVSPLGAIRHQPLTALEISINFRLFQWYKALP